ncbi:MAG: ABC transporter ATP-binding protein [Eubacteriales bacterium]|nr:ABC transporter ATP-binding protein [Eubacteriales bacterium]
MFETSNNKRKLALNEREKELLESLSTVEDYKAQADFNISSWQRFFALGKAKPSRYIKILIIMVLLSLADNAMPLLITVCIDNVIGEGRIELLPYIGLAIVVIVFAISFLDREFMLRGGVLESDIAYNVRDRGFHKLNKLSFSYYDKTAVGWLLSRLINDVTNVTELLAWEITNAMWSLSTVIILSIIMLLLNWRLSLLILVFMPFAIVLFRSFEHKMLIKQREMKRINSAITAAYSESIMGLETAKTLKLEKRMEEEFRFLNNYNKRLHLQVSKLNYLFQIIIGSFSVLSTSLLLLVGIRLVNNGEATIGVLATLILYTIRLWGPLNSIAESMLELQSAQAAIERIFHIFDAPVEIDDSPEALERFGPNDGEGEEAWPEFKGKIEFKNVSFYYMPDEPILENFNLTIEAGETLALVGETGAGKSSIVNLACRFYEPQEGQILFDGIDYRNYPKAWIYKNLGYVLQTPQLFSGTIADNIRYGKLEATDEELAETASFLGADDFIKQRSKGFNSEVGEFGSLLSTGEKQLVSFCRAIIRQPSFFVLDEATSSIDTETEKKIQTAIEKILEDRTALVVAHRLSTIKQADRIIVIEQGKIIEEGSHDQLMAKRGRYFDFYTGQFKISSD